MILLPYFLFQLSISLLSVYSLTSLCIHVKLLSLPFNQMRTMVPSAKTTSQQTKMMDNDSTYFQLSPCHPHKKNRYTIIVQKIWKDKMFWQDSLSPWEHILYKRQNKMRKQHELLKIMIVWQNKGEGKQKRIGIPHKGSVPSIFSYQNEGKPLPLIMFIPIHATKINILHFLVFT